MSSTVRLHGSLHRQLLASHSTAASACTSCRNANRGVDFCWWWSCEWAAGAAAVPPNLVSALLAARQFKCPHCKATQALPAGMEQAEPVLAQQHMHPAPYGAHSEQVRSHAGAADGHSCRRVRAWRKCN